MNSTQQSFDAFELVEKRLDELNKIMQSFWIVIITLMIFLHQIGFLMKEGGSIKI